MAPMAEARSAGSPPAAGSCSSWGRAPEKRRGGSRGRGPRGVEARAVRGSAAVEDDEGGAASRRRAGARPRGPDPPPSDWRGKGAAPPRQGAMLGGGRGAWGARIRPTATFLGPGAASPAGPPAAAMRERAAGEVASDSG